MSAKTSKYDDGLTREPILKYLSVQYSVLIGVVTKKTKKTLEFDQSISPYLLG